MNGRWRSVVAPVLAALLFAVLATPSQGAFPGRNGKIAFTTYYLDENENIYAIEPDGTGRTRLTADPGFDDDAAWSPNGRRIAFASNRAHPETACEGLNHPCDYDIYVMNADGSAVTRLTDSPGSERDPAWSPDGKRIVFSSTRDDTHTGGQFYNAELYVMNADGSSETRITNDDGVDHQASWSPDGTSIMFRGAPCEFNCIPHIYKVAPDGSGLTQLTFDTNGADRQPDWSPAGDKIVFARDVGQYHFFTMNPDGSDQALIFGAHGDPAWSPDGQRIAFGYPGIGHMNVDGSSSTTIDTSGGEKPAWQPLGPRRSDFKNAQEFCRAEGAFLGEDAFAEQYSENGSAANAFGKCVSDKS